MLPRDHTPTAVETQFAKQETKNFLAYICTSPDHRFVMVRHGHVIYHNHLRTAGRQRLSILAVLGFHIAVITLAQKARAANRDAKTPRSGEQVAHERGFRAQPVQTCLVP